MTSPDGTHYVFLRLGSNKGNSLIVNTVPLKAETVSFSTSKTIPSFDVPFSGMFSGESRTLAFNMGMASKTISVTGIITDMTITRKFEQTAAKYYDSSASSPNNSTDVAGDMFPTLNSDDEIVIDMTKEEIAQLIHSNTDGTALQDMQNMNELVILINSKVDSRYQYRNADKSSDLIPWSFSSRGFANSLDNDGAIVGVTEFPDSITDDGIKGFVRSFSCDIEAEMPNVISFTLEFEVAITV
tara:strand:- start:380 stop:1105 length:726 start_codon:yes stop_codon:yes gene_type:complete